MNFLSSNLYFLRTTKGYKQAEMQSQLSIARNTWSDWENSRTQPNVEKLIGIAEFFNVSVDELLRVDLAKGKLTGKADELKSDEKGKVKGKVIGKVPADFSSLNMEEEDPEFSTKQQDEEGIVFDITTRPVDRMIYQLGEDETYEFKPKVPVLKLPYLGKGLHIRVQMRGDSMTPTIKDGTYMVARHVPEPATVLREGSVYLIFSRIDGMRCTRIYRVEDAETLLLESDNPQYKAYQRKITDITAVFEVLELHSTDLSNDDPENTRLWNAIEDIRLKLGKGSNLNPT